LTILNGAFNLLIIEYQIKRVKKMSDLLLFLVFVLGILIGWNIAIFQFKASLKGDK